MKSVNDVFEPLSFILEVDHIRLCEDGTSAGHIGRLFAFEPQLDKIVQYLFDVPF